MKIPGGHHGTRYATCECQCNTAQRYCTYAASAVAQHAPYSTVSSLQEHSLPCATLTNWCLQCKLFAVRHQINFYILFSLRTSSCCCYRPVPYSSCAFSCYILPSVSVVAFRRVRQIAKSDSFVTCLSVCPHGTTQLLLDGFP